jgi:hypothetical protein
MNGLRESACICNSIFFGDMLFIIRYKTKKNTNTGFYLWGKYVEMFA